MKGSIEKSTKEHPQEPETRVKTTVHKSLALKFRDILRATQSIQTAYKATVQNKIKRQLKVTQKNATDEEIEELARDPEKAQEVLQEQF